ncbi:MAG: ParB/RepB/Spo0J family partition protein [Chlorobia bacterium]|nr:ParB/RepB/Spo0J family partition protein [Fimbriimonadaceae bacterium]
MRRAFGKGLSQLIAEDAIAEDAENATSVSIESISPNSRQPRLRFDNEALQELTQSIKEFGIIQPLLVRPTTKGKYELIAGERRLRAAKLAGLRLVPVVVRQATNEHSLELALIENIQREDINAMECARAYRQLIDEFSLTQEQVAAKVGKSRVAITNTLRLMKLPKRIQEAVGSGQISEAHARALLGFENDIHMIAVFDQVLEKGLTVKDVEQRAKSVTRPTKKAPKPISSQANIDPNTATLEEALSTYFGASTKIRKGEIGGELSIQFYSDDDLERILDILGFRL